MRIDGLTSTTPAPEPAPAAPRDEFLRLLVAQLEQQNPLDPQNGAEFVAQLAQFASLEQAAETNQRLQSLAEAQIADARTSLLGLVGRTVEASADTIAVDPSRGGHVPLKVELDSPAATVEVIITDAAGATIRTIDVSGQGSPVAVAWDMTDDKGAPVPRGDYHVAVKAKTANGTEVGARAVISGVVDAIDFADGTSVLSLGPLSLSPADILRALAT